MLPDVLNRRWPPDPRGWALYLLASLGSLILWITVAEGLARLRPRWPWLAWPATILVALLLPLWVAATQRYYATLHTCLPPSAVWFSCRNARYAWVLALEATTPLHRLLILASPLALTVFI